MLKQTRQFLNFIQGIRLCSYKNKTFIEQVEIVFTSRFDTKTSQVIKNYLKGKYFCCCPPNEIQKQRFRNDQGIGISYLLHH